MSKLTFIERSAALGNLVRKLREERNLSLAELAKPHCTRTQIHLIEMGKSGLSRRTADHLSMKLGVPISTFLKTVGPQTSIIVNDEHFLTIKTSSRKVDDGGELTLWTVTMQGSNIYSDSWSTYSEDRFSFFLHTVRRVCELAGVILREIQD